MLFDLGLRARVACLFVCLALGLSGTESSGSDEKAPLDRGPLLLSVLPADGGAVRLSPGASLSDLEVAKGYVLTAKARVGKVWNGWSSPQLVLSEAERLGTRLRFTMVQGLSISANFVDDPFVPSIVGSFSGLIRPVDGEDSRHDSEGSMAIRVSSTGGFSGLVRVGGGRWALRGTFDAEGAARFGEGLETEILLSRVPLAGYVLSLRLDLDPAGERRISGELRRQTREGSVVLSSVEANRHGFDGRTPETTAVAARYSWAMPAQLQTNGLEVTSYPQGDGVGFVWVSRRGEVRLVGVLADGARITASEYLDKDSKCPLFVSLEGGAGSLNGWMKVDGTRPDTDLAGEDLRWLKPVNMQAKRYPFGWSEGLELKLIGTRFAVVEGESVVPDLSEVSDSNAVLIFSQGGLTQEVKKELRISAKNGVSKQPASDSSYALKLSAGRGQFEGWFLHPNHGRANFTGVILQKGENRRGFGHFLTERSRGGGGVGASGSVVLETKFNPRPRLILSEFMASNESTIADEDRAFSDWIELYNPGAEAIDLSDWCLTDSASNLAKWRFPGVTLGAKEFLLVWASSKNRRVVGQPLHTNFNLSAGGEYLALVRPDGSTVEQAFSPLYPAQARDESYGIAFSSRSLVAPGANVRYLVPKNGALGTNWTARDFQDGSWARGKTGLGFGVGLPGFTVRQVAARPEFGSVDSIATCEALLALPKGSPLILSEATVVAPFVNYLGDGGDGNYTENAALPNGTAEPYAFRATGTITIPATGDYVFGLNSDDGGRIKIDGVAVMTDDSNHGPLDNLSAPVNLSAGLHTVEVIMWEGGGGDCVEFFAKAGTDAAWNADFRLVGAPGGLAVVTSPLGTDGGGGGVVATDVRSAMRAKNASCLVRMPFTVSGANALTGLTLKVRYQDGFIAYLNGTEVARRNAPADARFDSEALVQRSAAESLSAESIDVSDFLSLLTNGRNVLALHAMNEARDDGAFFILPELSARAGLAGNEVFFRPTGAAVTATPGVANGIPEFLGEVAPLDFSHPHGFHEKGFALAIRSATPGTSVRYTLDGSTPTATNGRLYSGPLRISRTSIVRAVGFRAGYEPTEVITQSYLFLDDVIAQSRTGAPPSREWPLGTVNGQVSDYGMDPEIVNSKNPEIGGIDQVKSALRAIPTLSVVTDLPNLFSIDSGIWVNPFGRGEAWERPASIEMIGDNGPGGGFGVNCGVRLRGGFSRSGDNPKHSFRLFFRSRYGAARLEYPLFGDEGASSFNKMDLRTAQNYSWSFGGDGNNTFLREESTREMQGAMGQPHTRSRYYHLYLNGQYWGLYETHERPEASFGESYLGGDEEDYDTVKGEQDQGYITGVTDGNLEAWEALRVKARVHFASPNDASYFAMRGLAADGTTRTSDPVLLDAENLIDYMLLTFWTANLDGATSAFLGDERANNWFAVRNRLGVSGGFKFLAHDFEHAFFNVDEDRTGPFEAGNRTVVETYNPMFLHHDLRPSVEYRMLWADRVQKHLFGGGKLRADEIQGRMLERKALLDRVIIAESARWGDSKMGEGPPLTRLDWVNAVNYVIDSFVPERSGRVIAQLRGDGLYPSFDAPELSQYGGPISSGAEVVISGNGGELYFTLDGSDPRLVGGALNPNAESYVSSSETITVVPFGQDWKYLGDGSDQGVSWRATGFDDTGWASGPGELGYGDGDEVTLVPFVDVDPLVPGDQKNATTYFRKQFQVSDLTGLTEASLRVRYDDSVILYLNGVEVGRSLNINSNPSFDQYASEGTPDENAYFTFNVDPGLFTLGNNVLAAEVHQADSGSSDISFNASLRITRTNRPSPLLLTGNGKKTLKVRALQSGEWSALVEGEFDVKQAADMTVSLSPNGTFVAGEVASYVVTARNVGAVASEGDVEVTVELPEGLDATGLSGSGWTILQGTGTSVRAYRGDVLGAGASFSDLVLNVVISKGAPAYATASARIGGGGEINTSNNQSTEMTLIGSTGLSEFSFSRSFYAGNEVEEGVNITVLRTGDRSGPASVRITTLDGRAKAVSDYGLQDQVLNFSDGELSQTVRIGLINDGVSELHERFRVKLSDVVGAASLGVPNDVSLTIIDPDEVAPTVSVSTPTEGAKVVASVVVLKGTARDEKGLFEVEASVNGGVFVKATLRTQADGRTGLYEVAVPAVGGLNEVKVRAIDVKGLVSNVATRRFVFNPLRPLSLLVVPGPNAGTAAVVAPAKASLIEVGKKVRLKAAARGGFRFEGWTVEGMSGTGLENPAIEVVMSEGLTVTARFVEEPFVASAIGEYQGLVVPDVGMERKWENQGAVQVTVTKQGAFTGRLKMGVMPQSFSGLFNTDGASRFGIARLPETTLPRTGRVPLVLSLQWDLTPPHGMTGRVGESLRDGSVREVAAFTGQLSLGQLVAGSPYLQGGGRFDLSLLPKVQTNLALGDYPQVPGTGLLTISRGGTVRIAMNLADGMRGTAAMPIQRTMRLPLYVPIYEASTGGITGEMRLIHGDAEGDIQAPDLLWFRPVLNRAPYSFGWPEGITLDGRADAQP
jgi:hypothetical protein